MLSSRYSDPTGGLQSARHGTMEQLARRLRGDPGRRLSAGEMQAVCRGFGALYYDVVVREMEKTVDRDEEAGPLKEAVQSFLRTFLPQALAESRGDPLVRYVREAIESQRGGRMNESV